MSEVAYKRLRATGSIVQGEARRTRPSGLQVWFVVGVSAGWLGLGLRKQGWLNSAQTYIIEMPSICRRSAFSEMAETSG